MPLVFSFLFLLPHTFFFTSASMQLVAGDYQVCTCSSSLSPTPAATSQCDLTRFQAGQNAVSRIWRGLGGGFLSPPTDLLALPVSPRDPAAAVAAVLNLVHLGELVADTARVAALRAHQGDEV